MLHSVKSVTELSFVTDAGDIFAMNAKAKVGTLAKLTKRVKMPATHKMKETATRKRES